MLKINKQNKCRYVNRSFRLPEEMTDQLKSISHENNLSMNQLVTQCLRYALENLDGSETSESDEISGTVI